MKKEIRVVSLEGKAIKVTFPHMGTVYIVLASLVRSLGGEVVIPPYTSKKTLSLGTQHSPEAVCLPYKLLLGNYIEAIENGAEALFMISSPGICRLGEYGKGIANAIEDLGYKVKIVNVDFYKGKFFECAAKLREVTGNDNPIDLMKALYLAVKKVIILDDLATLLSYNRAREINPGEAEKVYNRNLKKVDLATTTKEVKVAFNEAVEEFKKIELDDNKDVLVVELTGEIFMVLDPFSNQNLERELGKLGVQTKRNLAVSDWVRTAMFPSWLRKQETHLERAWKFAKPYLTRDIGGDALESVGDVVYAAKNNVDGIIHISPFTCMPEIMAQNIFPSIRRNEDVPVLSLVLDEQTGRAGYVTRLEAFVDLIARKKRIKSLAASSC
jgi:predicted nucleotide-binding protein (sugar kinase/HSP70/actin superfamily)